MDWPPQRLYHYSDREQCKRTALNVLQAWRMIPEDCSKKITRKLAQDSSGCVEEIR